MADKKYEVVVTRLGNELKAGDKLTATKLEDRGINVDDMLRVGAIKEYTTAKVEGEEGEEIAPTDTDLLKADKAKIAAITPPPSSKLPNS